MWGRAASRAEVRQGKPVYWPCFPGGSAGKESACNMGDLRSIPGSGRSPGEGKGYPLQYSGLENSMDCIVHGVTKSRTWLSDFHFRSPTGTVFLTGEAELKEVERMGACIHRQRTAWEFAGILCTFCLLVPVNSKNSHAAFLLHDEDSNRKHHRLPRLVPVCLVGPAESLAGYWMEGPSRVMKGQAGYLLSSSLYESHLGLGLPIQGHCFSQGSISPQGCGLSGFRKSLPPLVSSGQEC